MVELGLAGLNLVRLGLGLGLWETTGLVMQEPLPKVKL